MEQILENCKKFLYCTKMHCFYKNIHKKLWQCKKVGKQRNFLQRCRYMKKIRIKKEKKNKYTEIKNNNA